MLSRPITYKQFIIIILIIIIIFFSISLYNIYANANTNANTDTNIEQFESILNNLKNPSLKSVLLKNNSNKVKNKKTVTFDDLIKDAEDIDPSKYSVSNIKNSFFTYINSFGKDKFKNVSGTTTESLEKFGYFKDKFFDIFI